VAILRVGGLGKWTVVVAGERLSPNRAYTCCLGFDAHALGMATGLYADTVQVMVGIPGPQPCTTAVTLPS